MAAATLAVGRHGPFAALSAPRGLGEEAAGRGGEVQPIVDDPWGSWRTPRPPPWQATPTSWWATWTW